MMRRRAKQPRGGATTVEFAMVAPMIFLMLVGALEFGRACFVMHVLNEAARQGARVAVIGGSGVDDVQAAAAQVLIPAGISKYTLTVKPEVLERVEQWEPVTVSLAADFASVSWLPVPQYLDGTRLVGSCTLPREAERPK